MSFKDSIPQFEIVDIALIDPDPLHVRQHIPEDGLKGLANAIRKLGLIHPLVVRPAEAGRYVVLVGERRRQAALLAGESRVPVLIRACAAEEAVELRVFENIGLGVRSALESRDMANAIQTIAERFASPDEAAQYFGRAPTWLSQATAAAHLSEKVSALLDSGRISSTGAAVQLEKLARTDEAKAAALIGQIEHMPEGEKVSKKQVDEVLMADRPRSRSKSVAAPAEVPGVVAEALPESSPLAAETPPWEPSAALPDEPLSATAPPAPMMLRASARVHPGKVKQVAELLGLADEDEDVVLARLIDEFLALKQA